MFAQIISAVAMVSLLGSQTLVAQVAPPQPPAPIVQAAPSAPAIPAPKTHAAAPAQLVIPAGTAIPLTMVTEIHRKAMANGGPVRAQVMFPVTVGGRIAIPVGTFVDGTMDAPKKTNPSKLYPLIHFTHLTFANGYTAPLTADAASAMMIWPEQHEGARDVAYVSPYLGGARMMEATYDPDAQNRPRLLRASQYCPGYPYPCVDSPDTPAAAGPSKAVVLGAVGGSLALVVGMYLLGHHFANKASDLIMANGTQMQMKLTQPLTLDTAQVAAAASIGSI